MTELRYRPAHPAALAAEDREPFAALNDDPEVMAHFPTHLTRGAERRHGRPDHDVPR